MDPMNYGMNHYDQFFGQSIQNFRILRVLYFDLNTCHLINMLQTRDTVLAPPSTQDFSGKVGLNLALGLATSLFLSSYCMMETCMMLVGVRVHEHWCKPLGYE